MSSPSNRTWPVVGLYTPVSMLKNVVLPAPFGPIKLTVEPRGIVKSTSSTASKPPNSLRSCAVTRTSSLIGRLLPNEQGKGPRGKPCGFPFRAPPLTRRSQRRVGGGDTRRRKLVRETWFPSRERAESERRSRSRLLVLNRRVVHTGLEFELPPPLGEESLRSQQHHEHDDRP